MLSLWFLNKTVGWFWNRTCAKSTLRRLPPQRLSAQWASAASVGFTLDRSRRSNGSSTTVSFAWYTGLYLCTPVNLS